MNKIALLTGAAILGMAFSNMAMAETKLIMNTDTGVKEAIADNPKIQALAETGATKPVFKAAPVMEEVAPALDKPEPVIKSTLAEEVEASADVQALAAEYEEGAQEATDASGGILVDAAKIDAGLGGVHSEEHEAVEKVSDHMKQMDADIKVKAGVGVATIPKIDAQ